MTTVRDDNNLARPVWIQQARRKTIRAQNAARRFGLERIRAPLSIVRRMTVVADSSRVSAVLETKVLTTSATDKLDKKRANDHWLYPENRHAKIQTNSSRNSSGARRIWPFLTGSDRRRQLPRSLRNQSGNPTCVPEFNARNCQCPRST